jgi:hypothetical protein
MFNSGADPHTVTAYQSPNSGDAIAVLANGGASFLAVIDLTKMLALPRSTPNTCAGGTLSATGVGFIAVP